MYINTIPAILITLYKYVSLNHIICLNFISKIHYKVFKYILIGTFSCFKLFTFKNILNFEHNLFTGEISISSEKYFGRIS